jgi:chromosome segregation ATPase
MALERKQAELDAVKKLEAEAKQRLNELALVPRRLTSRAADERHRELGNRIAALEGQISEVTAVTREEMRDARNKIEESVVAVEMRRKSQVAEIARLEAERDSRDEKYEAVLAALQEEFDATKAALQMAIDNAAQKAVHTEQMIAKLGEHHQSQLSEALDDMRFVKQSVLITQKQEEEGQTTVRSMIRNIEALEAEKRAIVDELKIVRAEIGDLDEENAILRRELAKLNSAHRSLQNE